MSAEKDYVLYKKLSMIFNYQFNSDKGEDFFNFPFKIVYSKKTGRIRYILHNDTLIATLKPTNGNIVLSKKGAERFLSIVPKPKNRVIVNNDVAEEIMNGKDVYAKHIVDNDPDIRPSDELILVNEEDKLLGVGRAILSGEEMRVFNYGLAVKTRKGVN
ncbi:MAG: PUA domain-containing protein [Candidatus Odinarchaeia archaeon]